MIMLSLFAAVTMNLSVTVSIHKTNYRQDKVDAVDLEIFPVTLSNIESVRSNQPCEIRPIGKEKAQKLTGREVDGQHFYLVSMSIFADNPPPIEAFEGLYRNAALAASYDPQLKKLTATSARIGTFNGNKEGIPVVIAPPGPVDAIHCEAGADE